MHQEPTVRMPAFDPLDFVNKTWDVDWPDSYDGETELFFSSKFAVAHISPGAQTHGLKIGAIYILQANWTNLA